MLAIQKLYEVERIARNHQLRHDQIKELRQRLWVRILNAIEKRLKEHLPEILPKAIGEKQYNMPYPIGSNFAKNHPEIEPVKS